MKQPTTGFTLVEVIMTVSLATILMLVITYMIFQIYNFNAYTFAQANEVESARRGVAVWVRDVKEMTFGANGAYPIVVAEPNRLVFYSDIDRDEYIEYVEYLLMSETLYKYSTNPIGNPPIYNPDNPDVVFTLSEYIQNIDQVVPMFRYYDNNGEEILTPQTAITDIRYIEINIIVNIDPIRAPGEFMLKGSATPRNLKDNL